MAIVGTERLVYGVEDLETSTRFFENFGLVRETGDAARSSFLIPEGSRVQLLPMGHPDLPKGSHIVGSGA
jgi:hypothetical protein